MHDAWDPLMVVFFPPTQVMHGVLNSGHHTRDL